jgi:hypothetical protein
LQKICEEGRNPSESHYDANSSTSRKLEASNSEEFGTRELLCAISVAYDKINTSHGKFVFHCLVYTLCLSCTTATHGSLWYAYADCR